MDSVSFHKSHSRSRLTLPYRCRNGRSSFLGHHQLHAPQLAACNRSTAHRMSSTRTIRLRRCWLHRSCKPYRRYNLRLRTHRIPRHRRNHHSGKCRRSRNRYRHRHNRLPRLWRHRSCMLPHRGNPPLHIHRIRRLRPYRSSSCRHSRILLLRRHTLPNPLQWPDQHSYTHSG